MSKSKYIDLVKMLDFAKIPVYWMSVFWDFIIFYKLLDKKISGMEERHFFFNETLDTFYFKIYALDITKGQFR